MDIKEALRTMFMGTALKPIFRGQKSHLLYFQVVVATLIAKYGICNLMESLHGGNLGGR